MSKSIGEREVTRFLDAWFQMRQIIQAANFNRFHQAGLSATQFMILNILPEDDEGVSIGTLATRTNLKPATIAATVDSLEERGMVVREKSERDRRVVFVKITEEGRQLQNNAAGQFRSYITSLFRSMPAQERSALITGLESFVRAADEKVSG